MNTMQQYGSVRAFVSQVDLEEVYKDVHGSKKVDSIIGPLEVLEPKPKMPKNRFPGDSSTLAYM